MFLEEVKEWPFILLIIPNGWHTSEMKDEKYECGSTWLVMTE